MNDQFNNNHKENEQDLVNPIENNSTDNTNTQEESAAEPEINFVLEDLGESSHNTSSEDASTQTASGEKTEALGGKKKRFSFKKAVSRTTSGLVVVGLVLSAACGFGGGMLASRMNSSNGVMYQSVRQVSDSGSASEGEAMTTQQVVDTVGNSVVEIRTETVTRDQFFQQAVTEGAGSGVILSEDGYIVTNDHVVDGANTNNVTTKDGQSYTATLIGTDSSSDIALLKIDATGLTAAVMGDSSQLAVGESVIAIGNPLGELGGTVTEGIISATEREITIDGETMSMLQTDAAINPGNSGGGLFNTYGELVGIVDAKSTGSGVEGLGFAIPINDAKTVVESLRTNGYVTGRPALGVSLLDIDSSQAAMQYGVSSTGTYVAEVTQGSGAANAGIQVGDRIVSVDGNAVTTSEDVRSAITEKNVGDTVSIQVERDGQMVTLDVTLGEQSSSN